MKIHFLPPFLKGTTTYEQEVKSKQGIKMAYNFRPQMTNFCLPQPSFVPVKNNLNEEWHQLAGLVVAESILYREWLTEHCYNRRWIKVFSRKVESNLGVQTTVLVALKDDFLLLDDFQVHVRTVDFEFSQTQRLFRLLVSTSITSF